MDFRHNASERSWELYNIYTRIYIYANIYEYEYKHVRFTEASRGGFGASGAPPGTPRPDPGTFRGLPGIWDTPGPPSGTA